MIKPYTCYSAACDVCGDELDDGDGVKHFKTAADALAYVRELDCWWVGSDDTVVCELRNGAHTAKAQEIAAKLTTPDERKQFTQMWPDIDLSEFGPLFDAVMPGQTDLLDPEAVALAPGDWVRVNDSADSDYAECRGQITQTGCNNGTRTVLVNLGDRLCYFKPAELDRADGER